MNPQAMGGWEVAALFLRNLLFQPTPVLGHPFGNELRHAIDDLTPEENFIDVAHVQHVDDAAEKGAATFPPCEVRVQDEVVLDVNAFMFSKLRAPSHPREFHTRHLRHGYRTWS